MRTLILEPESQADYQLFVGLAQRLHIKFREEEIPMEGSSDNNPEQDFYSLFGSLEDVDSETVIDTITSARTTKETDISWTI
jgi:hypothetical protein